MSGEEGRQRFAYRQVEDLIASVHGAGRGPTALVGRFKYFQRLGFPGGSNTGRGSRAEYGIEQVLAFALAFELLETGMPPVRAVRIVRTSWQNAARAFAMAWANLNDHYSGKRVFLALAPAGLTEMGAAEDLLAPSPDLLNQVSQQSLVEWLDDCSGSGAPSLLILDPQRLVNTICRELTGLLEMAGGSPSLDTAFAEFGASLFGSGDPSHWG